MKIIFISATVATCYLIFVKFKATYDSNHDSFRPEFLVIPVAGLAVLVNHELSVMEVSCLFAYNSYYFLYLMFSNFIANLVL